MKNLKMKKLKFLVTVTLTMISLTAYCGGNAKLVSGSLSALTGKTIGIQYVYEGMTVGKYKAEADYILKKKTDYNKEEPGSGDKWEAAWKTDRLMRFESTFLMSLAENVAGTGIEFGTSGAYKMIVKTTFTEPGYNFGSSGAVAAIDTTYIFKDPSGKELATIVIKGATGNTFGAHDVDTGVRIAEAYASSGKILGQFISQSVK